jgi:hypothetical protein
MDASNEFDSMVRVLELTAGNSAGTTSDVSGAVEMGIDVGAGAANGVVDVKAFEDPDEANAEVGADVDEDMDVNAGAAEAVATPPGLADAEAEEEDEVEDQDEDEKDDREGVVKGMRGSLNVPATDAEADVRSDEAALGGSTGITMAVVACGAGGGLDDVLALPEEPCLTTAVGRAEVLLRSRS